MYMLTEPKAGWREVLIKENHNRFTYAEVVRYLTEEIYPNAAKITLVEDNLSAHKLSALYEILPAERARTIIERIELIRTPKGWKINYFPKFENWHTLFFYENSII